MKRRAARRDLVDIDGDMGNLTRDGGLMKMEI
jgi:hypothetical protein